MPVFSRFARYVEEVARRGSIRSAAEWLNIAPSAIDRQIILAEQELGVSLFDRLPQGLRLTPAGEHLVYNLRRWKREFKAVRLQIDDIQGLQRGKITLAVAEAIVGDMLVGLLADFHQQYPGVVVTIQVVGGGGVREMVLNGYADIGLTFMPTAYRVMRVEHSVELAPGIAMPPDHALAGRKSIRLRECRELPMILPNEELLIRNALDAALAATGVTLNAIAVSNNFALMKEMVFQRLGVAVLTRAEILSEIRKRKLAFVPFSDPEVAKSSFSLVTPSHPSSAASRLARAIVAAMDEMSDEEPA
ncbi:MAG: LysR family transcriptional regulator [Rhizobiales bacterium]|nr:LysR family transcriptional regulator [Hyphomicrobiales bacterium]